MVQTLSERIRRLVEPTLTQLGYELWGIQLNSSAGRSLLRVFIDAPQGITVTDCETVSRQFSAVLDVESPLSGQYTLEVSSPGLDRPLFTLEQYRRYIDSTIKLRLHEVREGRRNWVGTLIEVRGSHVVLSVEDQPVTLMFEEIEKANLVPKF